MAFTFTVNTDTVWPPLPTVQDEAEEWVAKIDYITSVNILNGFDVQVKGVTYHFSFQSSDQTNFLMMMAKAQSAVLAGVAGAQTVGLAEGEAVTGKSSGVFCTWQGHKDGVAYTLPFALPEFIAFATEIGNRKQALLEQGWSDKAKLRAVTTLEQLDAVVAELQIEERHRVAQELAQNLNPAEIEGIKTE